MPIGSYIKKVEVPAGQTIEIWDGVENLEFFDWNVVVTPFANFTGSIKIYIGDTVVKQQSYSNSKDKLVYATGMTEGPEIFPPTVQQSGINKVTGGSAPWLRGKVEIQNTGSATVVFTVLFARKYR